MKLTTKTKRKPTGHSCVCEYHCTQYTMQCRKVLMMLQTIMITCCCLLYRRRLRRRKHET